MPSTQKLLNRVLKKITPGTKENNAQNLLAERIIRQISEAEGRHVDVLLCGSNARNTHLKGDHDLDIFVLFPEKLDREEFEHEGLRIGKKVFRGKQWEKAYSEHPYIRGVIDGFDVEIVPSYKVEKGELLQSSVDRSVFHQRYLQKKLGAKKRQEIRLLKQFLKGIKAYGADIKASSVPGYALELLVLEYGSFLKALKNMSKWKQGTVIDLEKLLGKKKALEKFRGAPLIIIDPVDRNRNVAAALSLNQFSRIIAASKAFLKKPDMKYFFPRREKPWKIARLKKMLGKKELVAVKIGYPKGALSDIVWGQIQRLARKLKKQLKREEFEVLRNEAWTDEEKDIVLVFEVESLELQKAAVKRGPFVTDEKNSRAFLEKHTRLISGPRVEKGKWVIEVPRKYTRIEKLLQDFLKKEKHVEKAPLKRALNKTCRILQEKQIMELYKKNKEFAGFLSGYLKGEEEFL